MSAKTLMSRLVVVAAGASLCWGCASQGQHAQTASQAPLAEPQAVDETPYMPPASASPSEVSLFGDHPDAERVPYENRLLANMTQHTFSSVGRDFDPHLSRDGETIVFASTRNSEHADIFLKRVDGYSITQLTSDPSDDIQPRFSPDGQRVVFSSNRTGNWDVWVVNTDGTGLMQLTYDRTDEVAACFSPDGSEIAFTMWGPRTRQWEIWVMSATEPGVRRFLSYGMFPDWSPNGQQIAFQRARQRGTRWFSVWTIDLMEGEARHPTEIAYSDTMACIAPRWSADGRALVYCGVTAADEVTYDTDQVIADIWMVDMASGVRLKLTDGSAGCFNPTWGPTGRVYFVSTQTDVENIWSIASELDGYNSPTAAKRDGENAQISRAESTDKPGDRITD